MAGRPGRKPKMTLEEQIEQITNDIETYKTSIRTLEDKKKELLKQKREEDLSELYKYMQEMNLSVKDIKNIINQQNNNDLRALKIV